MHAQSGLKASFYDYFELKTMIHGLAKEKFDNFCPQYFIHYTKILVYHDCKFDYININDEGYGERDIFLNTWKIQEINSVLNREAFPLTHIDCFEAIWDFENFWTLEKNIGNWAVKLLVDACSFLTGYFEEPLIHAQDHGPKGIA